MKILTVFIAVCNLGFTSTVNQNMDCDQIFAFCPDAILYETDDRVYLRPDAIIVTSQGLYVSNMPISALFSDGTGCWLNKPSSYYWSCWTDGCPNYARVFYNSSGICPLCHQRGEPS